MSSRYKPSEVVTSLQEFLETYPTAPGTTGDTWDQYCYNRVQSLHGDLEYCVDLDYDFGFSSKEYAIALIGSAFGWYEYDPAPNFWAKCNDVWRNHLQSKGIPSDTSLGDGYVTIRKIKKPVQADREVLCARSSVSKFKEDEL